MSKTISNDLKTHIAGGLTTVATCWRLVRQDAQEFFFTDHDVDITVSGDTYEAATGMLPTQLRQSRGLAIDTMEAMATLESTKIDEVDIQAGLYDYATVDMFVVNYADLAMGVLYLAQGFVLGQVEIRDQAFTAEVRGKAQWLAQKIGDIYSPDCRADLGDSQCGVDLATSAETYWRSGTVTAVETSDDRRVFIDSALALGSGFDDFFRFGKLTWSTPGSGDSYNGNNAGFEMEVKVYDEATGEFELFEGMPYAIEIGDEFTVTYGCDKSAATCKARFANLVNFRGEPFVPGRNENIPITGRPIALEQNYPHPFN